MSSAASLTLASWADRLRPRGLHLLPQSHAVPVDVWLRRQGPLHDHEVLNLRARGIGVVLHVYDATDVTSLILRAECDCEAHRAAGAAHRPVLAPGATPRATATYDGAAARGWTGYEAGLLKVAEVAPIFEWLLSELDRAYATGRDGSVTQWLHDPGYNDADLPSTASASRS